MEKEREDILQAHTRPKSGMDGIITLRTLVVGSIIMVLGATVFQETYKVAKSMHDRKETLLEQNTHTLTIRHHPKTPINGVVTLWNNAMHHKRWKEMWEVSSSVVMDLEVPVPDEASAITKMYGERPHILLRKVPQSELEDTIVEHEIIHAFGQTKEARALPEVFSEGIVYYLGDTKETPFHTELDPSYLLQKLGGLFPSGWQLSHDGILLSLQLKALHTFWNEVERRDTTCIRNIMHTKSRVEPLNSAESLKAFIIQHCALAQQKNMKDFLQTVNIFDKRTTPLEVVYPVLVPPHTLELHCLALSAELTTEYQTDNYKRKFWFHKQELSHNTNDHDALVIEHGVAYPLTLTQLNQPVIFSLSIEKGEVFTFSFSPKTKTFFYAIP